MRARGACLFLLLFFGVGVRSDDFTPDGNHLLLNCQKAVNTINKIGSTESSLDAFKEGLCTGLITGVSETSHRVCPPPHVTNGQEVRIVVKYLQDHPAELHLRHTKLIEQALAEAFPCPAK